MTIDDSRFNINFGTMMPYVGLTPQTALDSGGSISDPLFNLSSVDSGISDPLFNFTSSNTDGVDISTFGGNMSLCQPMGLCSPFDMSSLSLTNMFLNMKFPDFNTSLPNWSFAGLGGNTNLSDNTSSTLNTPSSTGSTQRSRSSSFNFDTSVPSNLNTTKIHGVDSVAMRDLSLKGSIGPRNSVPYVAKANAGRLKALDNFLSSKGYKFRYTSAMGGSHASGPRSHGQGQKVDLVLDSGQQMRSEDVAWLRSHGFIGNGAIGWHNAGSGFHYDLYIGDRVTV